MAITNKESGTNVNEIADGIYRLSTVAAGCGGFTFSQDLMVEERCFCPTGCARCFRSCANRSRRMVEKLR